MTALDHEQVARLEKTLAAYRADDVDAFHVVDVLTWVLNDAHATDPVLHSEVHECSHGRPLTKHCWRCTFTMEKGLLS